MFCLTAFCPWSMICYGSGVVIISSSFTHQTQPSSAIPPALKHPRASVDEVSMYCLHSDVTEVGN